MGGGGGGGGEVGRERGEGGRLRKGWSVSHQVWRIGSTLVVLRGGGREDKTTRLPTVSGPITHGNGWGHVGGDGDRYERRSGSKGGGEDGRKGNGRSVAILLVL